MEITPQNIALWIGLFMQAEQLGERVVAAVKEIAHKTLTPEENAAVLRAWEDNVQRAGRNAGLA